MDGGFVYHAEAETLQIMPSVFPVSYLGFNFQF